MLQQINASNGAIYSSDCDTDNIAEQECSLQSPLIVETPVMSASTPTTSTSIFSEVERP